MAFNWFLPEIFDVHSQLLLTITTAVSDRISVSVQESVIAVIVLTYYFWFNPIQLLICIARRHRGF